VLPPLVLHYLEGLSHACHIQRHTRRLCTRDGEQAAVWLGYGCGFIGTFQTRSGLAALTQAASAAARLSKDGKGGSEADSTLSQPNSQYRDRCQRIKARVQLLRLDSSASIRCCYRDRTVVVIMSKPWRRCRSAVSHVTHTDLPLWLGSRQSTVRVLRGWCRGGECGAKAQAPLRLSAETQRHSEASQRSHRPRPGPVRVGKGASRPTPRSLAVTRSDAIAGWRASR